VNRCAALSRVSRRGTALLPHTGLVQFLTLEEVRAHALALGCTPSQLEEASPRIDVYVAGDCRWLDAVKSALKVDLFEILAETSPCSPFRLDPP